MYKINFNNKIHVHFIGIGGISMSGLAEILLGAGFTISGSDRDSSDLTKHLEVIGAKFNYPQAAENITDDIDLIVCHQANLRIIDSVKKRFKGHEDKFYVNIDKYGNTSAASIPIALSELDDENKLKGKRCIIAGFGAGLNYSGILAKI